MLSVKNSVSIGPVWLDRVFDVPEHLLNPSSDTCVMSAIHGCERALLGDGGLLGNEVRYSMID